METLPTCRKRYPICTTCSSLPTETGKHIRPSSSLSSYCACLAQSAHSLRTGSTALFCGLPLSTVSQGRNESQHYLTISSHCINLHLHRSSNSHTEQTKPAMGIYNRHGRLGLGQQGLLVPSWVCLNQCMHTDTSLIIHSFLSVAWTMTDYDGTTQ
jgi:hypothetical protein